MSDALAGERWIIDGNFVSTLDPRLPRADKIILLDRSRLVCLARVARRVAVSLGRTRTDVAPGCPEKIDWEFVKYVWNFPNTQWTTTLAAITRNGAWDRTITFKNDAETTAFLRTLQPRAVKLNAT